MRIREMLYGRFFTFLPRVREFLLDTVFPERAVCRACGRVSEGGVLCPECKDRLRSDGFSIAWDREELEPGLDAYVLRPHTGVARQLVLRLKHSAEKCVADELADLILPVPDHISFPPDTVVTWVPMPEGRRRERCIDHGRVLAEAAAWIPGTGPRRPSAGPTGKPTLPAPSRPPEKSVSLFSWWTMC